MGESLLVQQQWYDVTRARNQTTIALEFDRGDVRRHQISTITRQELLYKGLAKILRATWYIMETAQDRLDDIGESISPLTFRKACTVWTVPRRLKSRSEGEITVISPSTVSVKYNSYQ